MTKEGAPLKIDDMSRLVEERITRPTTSLLYREFLESGMNGELIKIFDGLSDDEVSPVIHTLIAHVTKEKPVFIYKLGAHLSKDVDKTESVAVMVDMLWCLSLVIDDIIDGDIERAGMETSWVRFGKDPTRISAQLVLDRLLSLNEDILGESSRELIVASINKSMVSLNSDQVRDFYSGVSDIEKNIDERADFHCSLPAILLCSDREAEVFRQVLFLSNRAGQVLNDVKDLIRSNIYGRERFSDIRSGTLTIPLILMRDALEVDERTRLEGLFGTGNLSLIDRNWLDQMVEDRFPKDELFKYVAEVYDAFLEKARSVVGEKDIGVFLAWHRYKMEQAISLLQNER